MLFSIKFLIKCQKSPHKNKSSDILKHTNLCCLFEFSVDLEFLILVQYRELLNLENGPKIPEVKFYYKIPSKKFPGSYSTNSVNFPIYLETVKKFRTLEICPEIY